MTGLLAISLFALAGPAAAKDRNHDWIPDRSGKRYHLSLHKSQANQDHDGLANRREFRASTSPRDPGPAKRRPSTPLRSRRACPRRL
jgi:hypothetical protein